MNRMKDVVTGVKEAMLDQIASTIIKEDFHDVIETVKSYDRADGAVLDVPEDPAWEQGFKDFVALHRVEHKSLNYEINAVKLKAKD